MTKVKRLTKFCLGRASALSHTAGILARISTRVWQSFMWDSFRYEYCRNPYWYE